MKKPKWAILLLVSTVMELGLLTFCKNLGGSLIAPALWLAAGIAGAVAAFMLSGMSGEEEIPVRSKTKITDYAVVFGIFILGSTLCAERLADIFIRFPIDPGTSDIVPSLQLYVRRFLTGEPVYATLVFPQHEVNPTYFPLMWMPYVVPEIMNMDYRWAPYGMFLAVMYLYYWPLAEDNEPLIEKAVKAALPFVFLLVCMAFSGSMFGYAVELVPISFYLFLCATLFSSNRWMTGIGILGCLLSRYAFTFWLPVFMLLTWVRTGWKNTMKMAVVMLAGVVLLYVLPFWSKDPSILTKGLAYYEKTALGQWNIQGWQQPGEKPFHLAQGLSFSGYIYDIVPGAASDKMRVAKKWHMTACAAAAIFILVCFAFLRHRSLHFPWFALASLKFYLAVFYGFWYVPFSYLYLLPLFISLPVLFKTKIFSNFAK